MAKRRTCSKIWCNISRYFSFFWRRLVMISSRLLLIALKSTFSSLRCKGSRLLVTSYYLSAAVVPLLLQANLTTVVSSCLPFACNYTANTFNEFPRKSTDSERELGLQYRIEKIVLKTESGKTRIQLTYNDGYREIVKDVCLSKFGAYLLTQGASSLEGIAAKNSLKLFSRFLLDHNVQVSSGYDCWNLLCSGRECGIRASRGMFFMPPENLEVFGNMASSPNEQGHYKVHLTTPISHKGRVTNQIMLRKGVRYLIAGQVDASVEHYHNASSHPRPACECEQCTEGGISRDLTEAVLNPLAILFQRYQSTGVAGLGVWEATSRALVRRDKDGTYRIKGFLGPNTYSEFPCAHCKSVEKVARCRNQCLEQFSGSRDGSDLDIVEPGSAAVVGSAFDFCFRKFNRLRKALRRVTERLDTFGVKQGGPVLSDIGSLVGATRAEVVFVLNNDTSLVQPIIRGANCFLRRDERGRWESSDNLRGSELNKKIFSIDQAGTWIMIGTGEKFGVSCTDGRNYHLEVGGQRMMYSAHLDSQLFGGHGM